MGNGHAGEMQSGTGGVRLWCMIEAIHIEWLLRLLTLGAVGLVFLMWRKNWPYRKASEPRCGRCQYVVLGLARGRCPECDSDLLEEGVIPPGQGVRSPWWEVIWSTALLTLMFAFLTWPVVATLRYVQWMKLEHVERTQEVTLVTRELKATLRFVAHGEGYGSVEGLKVRRVSVGGGGAQVDVYVGRELQVDRGSAVSASWSRELAGSLVAGAGLARTDGRFADNQDRLYVAVERLAVARVDDAVNVLSNAFSLHDENQRWLLQYHRTRSSSKLIYDGVDVGYLLLVGLWLFLMRMLVRFRFPLARGAAAAALMKLEGAEVKREL